MADPRLRQLTIKSGVLKRLTKEKQVYEKELENERTRIEKYKNEGRDEHLIKKQEEIVQESLMMIPDCKRRLNKAYEELNDLIKNEDELKETEEYQKALEILNQANAAIASS